MTVLEGYGLSETSPGVSFNRRDRERKVGSVGLPVWGVEVRVVDPDDNPVPMPASPAKWSCAATA